MKTVNSSKASVHVYQTTRRHISVDSPVTLMNDYRRGFGLSIGFIDHSQVVTTNNYNIIADLHSLQITTR
jgi:hypothetical protein